MELKKLTIKNYRNIENLSLEFDGNSKIVGDNRLGKTNILESIYWLLTNHIQDIKAVKPVNNQESTVVVEGIFIHNKKEVVIKKEYKDSPSYYIDECKYATKKDYEKAVRNLLGINYNGNLDIIRIMVDPFYVGELCENKEWKSVRNLITEQLGTIDFSQIDDRLKKVWNEKSSKIDSDIKNKKLEIQKLDSKLELLVELEHSIKDTESSMYGKLYQETLKSVENDLKMTKFIELATESIHKKEENIGKELIKLEQLKDLVDELQEEKIKIINSCVEQHFGDVRFKLFDTNQNGTIEQICKPYIHKTNIVWKEGSKSEMLITGIEIIEKLKQLLNLPDLPILFDEGGEISSKTLKNKIKTNSQIICVKVVDDLDSINVKNL